METPQDKNTRQVLDLLTMLHLARKQHYPKLSEAEQSLLVVTKEHIALTELPIATFIKTLNQIGHKGYLFAVSIFEEKYHKLFQQMQQKDVFSEIMQKLEGSKKNAISSTDKKKYFEPLVKTLVPLKYLRNSEDVISEDLTFSSLLAESNEVIGNHTSKNISYVLLSPYRHINRLLDKLDGGESLKDIRDQEIWFDPLNNTVHYLGGSLYLGNIVRAKDALLALFSQERPDMIYFYDIQESSQDPRNKKELKAYYDSLLHVLQKDLKLKDIFILHFDHLEIKSQYRDQAH